VDETKWQLKTLYAKIHGFTPLTRVVCIINLKTIVYMYYVIYFYFRFMCIKMFHVANDTWFIHVISTMYIILKRINFFEGSNLDST